MAELGRRDEVVDPLALNPREKGPDRSLPTYGVRNPGQSGGNKVTQRNMSVLNTLDGIRATVSRAFEKSNEEALTEGKIKWMRGETEASLGDSKYGKQGWQAMEAANTGNDWYVKQLDFISNGQGKYMSPEEYEQFLMKSRDEQFKNLPQDPAARKMWVASFEDFGPRLMATQVETHNKYNIERGKAEFGNFLMGGGTRADASQPTEGRGYRVSMQPVRAPYRVPLDPNERDIAIKTVLGEAAGEDLEGQAAVAQVLLNRTQSGRFPNSLKEVALQYKQFSAWNSGEGGNNPNKWAPDSIAYQRAARVVDDVMSGRVPDMTGGATHYANKDVVTPYWWDEESSGKDVKIGNHTFAAATAKEGSVVTQGELAFNHKEQSGINEGLRTILTNASSQLGMQLKITSGTRSAEYNASVGGAEDSRHVHGDAADIDMSGMDDNERYALLQELRAQGVKRFITYSKSPNMLHVDMSEANGPEWFMFDKSNKNIGKAPTWFQTAAGEARPETGKQALPTGTEIQRFIQSSTLSASDKAEVLADSMARTLSSGDDSLFVDSGGIATLMGLGADADMIAKVYKARDDFEAKKDKEFDLQFESARADLMTRVSNGEFASQEEALAAVDEFYRTQGGSASHAQSLARSVAAEWNKGKSDVVPIKMRSFVAQKYDAVTTGAQTPEEAAAEIEAFGKKEKIKDSVLNNFMESMFATDRDRKNRSRTEAATLLKKQEAEKQVITQATSALANGYGLKGLTGQVQIPDDTPGNEGKTKTVSGEEYGVWAIKKSTQDDLNKAVADGTLSKEQAEVEYYNTVYEGLAKQGVYDTEFGRQIASTLKGDLIDKKTGEVREDALQALSFYMQMSNNPSVGASYMAGMVPDEEARTMLETASHFYNGQLNLGAALQAAQGVLTEKLDPAQQLEKTEYFSRKSMTAIRGAVDAVAGKDGFWKILNPLGTISNEDLASATENSTAMRNYIYQQANTYHLRNKNEPVDVSVKKAQADLERNSVIVGGKILIGNEQSGTRMDQVMGLAHVGRQAPDEAIRDWLEDVAGSDEEWGALWRDRTGLGLNLTAGLGEYDSAPGKWLVYKKQPQFDTTFNPMNGTIELNLFKDGSRTEYVGEPIVLDAKLIGDRYKAKKAVGKETGMTKAWRDWVIDPIVDKAQNRNMQMSGADIGSMMK